MTEEYVDQVCRAQERPVVRVRWFFQFYYEAFVGPLKTFSNKFSPATDAAIDELLSFQVEV
jgi:hypothetical protein